MNIRIATLNVGSMTEKEYEMVEMMEKRKLEVLCVQETKWKGIKAKNLGGGYKNYTTMEWTAGEMASGLS